jgi:hypothetical protein
MLSPEALHLEGLRQQIQNLQQEINKEVGIVDHGRPEPKPTPKVKKLREQSQQARAQLHAALESVRRSKPEAITEWINYHKGFLERIQAETSTEMNADTRRGFAGFCLQQWEKVAAGEQEFVYINEHFLKDYNTEVSNRAPKISVPQVPEPQAASKSWWQFWK